MRVPILTLVLSTVFLIAAPQITRAEQPHRSPEQVLFRADWSAGIAGWPVSSPHVWAVRSGALTSSIDGAAVLASPNRVQLGAQSGGASLADTGGTAGSTAEQLAARVIGAHDTESRSTAILDVAKALHFGVYSVKGKVILRGSERSSKDFYLYQPEVQALARAMGDSRMWSLDDLAATLTQSGLTLHGGAPITGTSLHHLLVNGIRAAVTRPNDPRTLDALLIQQLSLHHQPQQDLTAILPDGDVHLDALQIFLLDADFLLPLSRSGRGQPALQAHLRTVDRGLAKSPCPSISKKGAVPPAPSGWFTFNSTDGPFDESAQGKSLSLVDALHGVLLGTIGVGTLVENPDGTTTHYGPLPGAKSLHFIAHLMSYEVGGTISCGPLGGVSLPPPGPIQGAVIHWGVGTLSKFGQVTESPAGGVTDKNGEARLIFTPNNEKVPGFGPYSAEIGYLTVDSTVVTVPPKSKFVVQEAAAAPIRIRWVVSHHVPRGFFFTFKWRDYGQDNDADAGAEDPNHDAYDDEFITVRKCGDGLFDGPATVTEKVENVDPSEGFDAIVVNKTWTVTLTDTYQLYTTVALHFHLSEPFGVHVDVQPFSDTTDTIEPASQDVPLTEDMSCPAPAR